MDPAGWPYQYLAIMQDRFSRQLYARPLADKLPSTVQRAVDETLTEAGANGTVNEINTDAGSELKGGL